MVENENDTAKLYMNGPEVLKFSLDLVPIATKELLEKASLSQKDISLFLNTKNPNLTYRGTLIPVQNPKVYINFISLIKTDPKIKKILDEEDFKSGEYNIHWLEHWLADQVQ